MSSLLQPNRYLSQRVHVYRPAEVTRIADEVDPTSVGLDPTVPETIWKSVTDYYRFGLQPAIALCVRRHGKVILDRTIGHARGNGTASDQANPEVATPSTLFNLFSGSKVFTAMLIHLLDERGQLAIDDPVCRYIDDFRKHGKHAITIRHLLSHRAGIATAPREALDLDILNDREAILEIMCSLKPTTPVGKTLAYHALTSGFVLGELVHRVTGRDVRQFLDEEVRTPLGFAATGFGVSAEDVGRVAQECYTGPKPPKRLGQLLEDSLNLSMDRVVEVANDPRFLTAIVPSGNIIGTANEVGRFFDLLVQGGTLDGVRVFGRRTVRRAVAEQSWMEWDRIIKLPIRYGLGVMLGGRKVSFYGDNTPQAFGHLGFTNVLAWADPERAISVALMNNGKPFVTPELLAWLRIPRVISRCIPRDQPSW